jgi:signal peptidase I
MVEQFPAAEPPAPPRRPRLKSARQWWRDIIEIVMIVVTIYTFVNLMTARAIIEGVSMEPNFHTGQLVIINRFSYYFRVPTRGDVVVITNPTSSCKDVVKPQGLDFPVFSTNENDPCPDFIKRVVGLPGETIELRSEGTGEAKVWRVFVNGVEIDEPYIAQFCNTDCTNRTWTLGSDEYFMLGDNRSHSYDSHLLGPISRAHIVGQAWVRYWPLDSAGVIPHPSYIPIPSDPPATPTPTAAPESTQAATAVR